jgi:Ca-activated chloride channel family protein
VARSVASQPKFTLPAGTYYVVARRGTAEARERITIGAGDTDRRALVLDLAQLSLAVRLPGLRLDGSESVSHRIERIGGDARDVLYINRASGTVPVAAGRYKLETRLGIGNVLIEREIELRPGASEQVTIEPPAGGLVLRLLDGPGGTAIADVAWDIRDAQGRTIWIGNQTEARPLLLAGRYTIVAGTRGRQTERPVEVRQGELRTFDIVPQ